MRKLGRVVLPLLLLAGAGCGREKSTDELVSDLKSKDDKDRIIAVRLLGQRKDNAARTVPALVEALKDHEPDVRRSAANGLGYFGADAREAIPALQAALKDRDARVRESAGVALSRIDPTNFTAPSAHRKGK
jgi:HEAT repeat protein